MFLQSSAKLATCFAYIGVALRSALRMGLHRSFRDNFGTIECEERKRTFWVIRKMDVFVAAMLGLPITLSEADIDQDLPTEVDDNYITAEGILSMPAGEITNQSAANADFQITDIIIKIVRCIYPIKGFQNMDKNSATTFAIPYSVVHDIENDLESWKNNLPDIFKPGTEAPGHIIRAQQLLRITFAHAQMMLYRPFLHYASHKYRAQTGDQRPHTCAVACIAVSRNIVHLTVEMKKRGFLIGSQWFTMYTAFFAVLSLVFFALENRSEPTSREIMREAWEGKEILASVAQRSMAADRCTATLNTLFSKISLTAAIDDEAIQDSSSPVLSKQTTRSHIELPSTLKDLSTEVPTRAHSFPQNRKKGGQSGGQRARAPKPKGLNIPPRPNVSPAMYSAVPHSTTPHSSTQRMAYSASALQHQFPQDPRYSQPQQSSFQYSGGPENISTTMFPSQDPFVYPNQPITSLAQSGENPYVPSYQQSGFLPSNVGKRTSPSDDHIDVHLMGPMPPYVGQGQQAGSFGGVPALAQSQQPAPQMWDQARSHGLPMDLDDIFGGEGMERESSE